MVIRARYLATILAVLVGGASPASADFPALSPANDLDGPGIVFAFAWPDTRSRLTLESLETGNIQNPPLPTSAFPPSGALAGLGDPLQGYLVVPETRATVHARGDKVDPEISLPATTLSLLSHGDRLLTVQPSDDILIRPARRFTLHFGEGRIWREAADDVRSRALLPVTLIDSRHRAAYNGLALFLYGGGAPPSPMFIQFTQETAPERAADLWAVVATEFTEGAVDGAAAIIEDFETRKARSPDYRDWADLPGYPASALEEFDGPTDAMEAISVSGMVIDETVYLKGCATRTGPYPFCRQMRHALGSASGTLLGFAAVANLTSRFGSEVFKDTIAKRLPELAGHPTWSRVTPRDVLNMAIGVEGGTRESGVISSEALEATTRADILAGSVNTVAAVDPPGARYVDRPNDWLTLSVALDAHAKSRFGPTGSLRAALDEGFFEPMGLARVRVQVTDGAAPQDRVPDLASGFYPTTDELARVIAALLRTEDRTLKSGFDGALSRAALEPNEALGLEVGREPDASPVRWHLGFWRHPVAITPDCLRFVASARGTGGTVVSLMPNRIAAFRLADGTATMPPAEDDRALHAAAHLARAFCD